MKQPWIGSRNMLWFVIGSNKALWCSTASFTKRGAIKHWQEQQPDDSRPWRWWYRQGFRCRRVKLKYSPQS